MLRGATWLLLLVLAAPALRAVDTELRLPVTRGETLEVGNFAGRVEVRSREGTEVRVVAHHGAGDEILVRREGGVVELVSSGWAAGAESFQIDPERVVIRLGDAALPGEVVYEIEAPPWLPLRIRGPLTSALVSGRSGGVEIAVVRGAVRVSESSGPVTVTCLEGTVDLDRTAGAVEVVGGATDVTLSRSADTCRVETTSGGIEIRTPDDGASIEAITVGGRIGWSGAVPGGGAVLASHSGEVGVALPVAAGARLEVWTFQGRLETSRGLELQEEAGIRRLSAVLGDGGGRLEIETFSGVIRLE